MSMYRTLGQHVINGKKTGGVLFSGEFQEDVWDVSIFEVNGHREVSARQVIKWTEIGDWQEHRDACGNLVEGEPLTEKQLEEERLKVLEKAGRRAQTKARRLIKAGNFRELLTGTYRENQTDRELFLKHLRSFVDAMLYVLPKFQYVLSFEKQDRGAYHFHAACTKLPRWVRYRGEKIEGWTLPTLIWRKIVGEDNGLVFVGGKPRWGTTRRRNLSLAKLASYVSKYILKDYADAPAGTKRYWSSRSVSSELPKVERLRLEHCKLADLVQVAFELPEGHVIVSHRIGRWGDSYWLCTEPGA